MRFFEVSSGPGEPRWRTFSAVSFEASTEPKDLATFRTSVELRSKREIRAGWTAPISRRKKSKIDSGPIKLLRMTFARFGDFCRRLSLSIECFSPKFEVCARWL